MPVDRQKLIDASEEIAHMWEVTFFDRSLRRNADRMLKGLKNTRRIAHGRDIQPEFLQPLETLEQYGVRQYFDDITLSSIVGYRKPHPYIFKIALYQGRLKPEECAFVGDTLSRDVVGPRKMGYGRVFKINSELTPVKDIGTYDGFAPDYEIQDIYDVYRILKDERQEA